MLANVFKAIFITSCMGTALALALYIIRPLTKKFFSAGWNYYVWLTVLIVMILPVRVSIPREYAPPAENNLSYNTVSDTHVEVPEIPNVPNDPAGSEMAENLPITVSEEKQESIDVHRIIGNFADEHIERISMVWIIGVILLLLIKISGYWHFLYKTRANSKVVPCPELANYTNRNVVTRVCGLITSPLMTGVIKPTLLLPETDLTDNQMCNVLAHELTHLKRNDILYKWFANIVKCIHWFNPVVYLVNKTINEECEISCDLSVVSKMSGDEEKTYINTILSLLSSKETRVNSLTTEMSGKKDFLKKRFAMIKFRKKISKKVMIISAVIAVAVLAAAVLIGGVISGIFFKKPAEEDIIKLTNNGQRILFDNQPFIQNEMVYFPLEEIVTKLNENNRVEANGDKYTIYVENASESYTVKADAKEIYYSGQGGALRETKYAPVLKDDLIYIPYEYIRYIFIDTNNYNIGGSTLYKNEKMNIQFEIPLGWCGKYIVDETDVNENVISFKHKATAEKYDGAGGLFTVYKLADAEVDEHLRIYGNSTVVWRNEEYAYVVGRPTDVQYPIWVDRDKEDINIAEEYEELYGGITYIEETFKLSDESAEKKIPIIENAENMSYAEIRDLQRMVDEGHFPWRLDYEQVIMMYVSGQGEDVEYGSIVAFSGGGQECSATYVVNGNTYIVELFKPIRNDDAGIWIVRSCKKVDTAIIKEVSFYNINPNYNTLDGEVVKQEDGWYRFTSDTCMFINFDGIRPNSVSVYFTPTGTNMEQYKKQIGYANPPFPQIPISVNLNFSNDDTMGHLQFVFNYEDGRSVESEIYKVYRE